MGHTAVNAFKRSEDHAGRPSRAGILPCLHQIISDTFMSGLVDGHVNQSSKSSHSDKFYRGRPQFPKSTRLFPLTRLLTRIPIRCSAVLADSGYRKKLQDSLHQLQDPWLVERGVEQSSIKLELSAGIYSSVVQFRASTDVSEQQVSLQHQHILSLSYASNGAESLLSSVVTNNAN